MGRFRDFDAEWEAKEPLTLRAFGDTWELPGELPAKVVLQVARWSADGRAGTTLTKGELILLAADLIPAEIMAAWEGLGMTPSQLEEIVPWVLSEYMRAGRGETDPPGEAAAPETGAALTSF